MLRRAIEAAVRLKGGFGGHQRILIGWKNGVLHGALELRETDTLRGSKHLAQGRKLPRHSSYGASFQRTACGGLMR